MSYFKLAIYQISRDVIKHICSEHKMLSVRYLHYKPNHKVQDTFQYLPETVRYLCIFFNSTFLLALLVMGKLLNVEIKVNGRNNKRHTRCMK